MGGIAGGAVWAKSVARADDLVVHGVEDAAEDVGGGGSAGGEERDEIVKEGWPPRGVLVANEECGDLRELVLDERGDGRVHARGCLVDPGGDRAAERGGVVGGERGETVAAGVDERLEAPEAHLGVGGGLIPTNARAPRVGGYLSSGRESRREEGGQRGARRGPSDASAVGGFLVTSRRTGANERGVDERRT